MMSWLVDMGTLFIAIFPIPTLVPTMIEFSGTTLAALDAIAFSVIHSTASALSINPPLRATVVIHGILPLKYSWLPLGGVPPD